MIMGIGTLKRVFGGGKVPNYEAFLLSVSFLYNVSSYNKFEQGKSVTVQVAWKFPTTSIKTTKRCFLSDYCAWCNEKTRLDERIRIDR